MTYALSDARQQLLDAIGAASEELAYALACLGEAYEKLDQQNADRLEAGLFRSVQVAFGRAKRTHAEFASRYGLGPRTFEQQAEGAASSGAADVVARAVEAVGEADRGLAELQDSMLPVEAGDEELRAGLAAVRAPLNGVPTQARELLRTLGR